MSKPTEVTVAGVPFKITYPAKLDNPDEVGESNAIDRTIKIRADQKGDVLERTLLHEIIHAALGVGGMAEVLHGKAEEGVVVCLENALHALYERRT